MQIYTSTFLFQMYGMNYTFSPLGTGFVLQGVLTMKY